jgi:hypothetical protein
MPSINDDLNLPSKQNEDFSIKRITSRPIKPKNTLKKAVSIAPNAGAAIRINRKLAPHIAARRSNLM